VGLAMLRRSKPCEMCGLDDGTVRYIVVPEDEGEPQREVRVCHGCALEDRRLEEKYREKGQGER